MRTMAWLLLALGCQALPGARERVTVGVSLLGISVPVFVAKERGLFARHGLEVTLERFETAQPLADAVLAGQVEAGGYVAYPIALLASRNARPALLATSLVEDSEHRLSYVLARAGSPLRFPRDAAGRRIGILPTVAYRRWLDAILRAAHVDPAQVAVMPIAPPLQALTLAAGAVDFLFTNDPMATRMLASGAARVVDDGPPCATHLGSPFEFGSFLLGMDLASRRPDVARRLVAALDEAILLLRTAPGAASARLPYLRPDERPFAARQPPTGHVTSDEARGRLGVEIARERALGILAFEPRISAWLP